MTQSLQGKYRPKEYADIIGNHEAIETILSHVADNGGSYMGLAFLLMGKSGQGKGMLSELMIQHCEQLIGGDVNVIYADTFSSEDFTKKIAQWESECCEQGSVFGNMRTYGARFVSCSRNVLRTACRKFRRF
jgi:replication-associated recombination protein RarA